MTPTPSATINYGSIQLPTWQEIDDFKSKVDRLEEIISTLQPISQKNPEEITESDANTVKALSKESQNLANDLFGVGATINPGSGLPSQSPISIRLDSNPSDREGDIEKNSEITRAILPGGGGGIGTLTNTSGTTSFSASFTPNGNYGSLILQGKVGDDLSNVVTITATGQTREQAQDELEAKLREIDAQFERFLTGLAVLAGILAAITVVFIGAAIAATGTGPGLLIPLLLAIAAAGATLWTLEQRQVVNGRKEEIKRKLKDSAETLIDQLPSDGSNQ